MAAVSDVGEEMDQQDIASTLLGLLDPPPELVDNNMETLPVPEVNLPLNHFVNSLPTAESVVSPAAAAVIRLLPNCQIIYPVKRYSLTRLPNPGEYGIQQTLKLPLPRLQPAPVAVDPNTTSSFASNQYVFVPVPQPMPPGHGDPQTSLSLNKKSLDADDCHGNDSSCSVALCRNYRTKKGCENILFHSFPKDRIYRDIWITRCRQQLAGGGKWKPAIRGAVCSAHFAADAYRSTSATGQPLLRKLLLPDALPTVFDCLPEHLRPREVLPGVFHRPPPRVRPDLGPTVYKRRKYPVGTQTETQGADIERLVADSEQMQADLDESLEVQAKLTARNQTLKLEMEAMQMETARLRAEIQSQAQLYSAAVKRAVASEEAQKQLRDNDRFRVEKFRNRDSIIRRLTGYPTFAVLEAVFQDFAEGFDLNAVNLQGDGKTPDRSRRGSSQPILTYFNQFFLTLIKLRLCLGDQVLGAVFGICENTVRRYYNAWVGLMNESLVIPAV